MKTIVRFFKDEEGVSMAEYGLLLALIIVAGVTVISTFRANLNTAFSKAGSQFT